MQYIFRFWLILLCYVNYRDIGLNGLPFYFYIVTSKFDVNVNQIIHARWLEFGDKVI